MKRTLLTACLFTFTFFAYAQGPCQANFSSYQTANGTQFNDLSIAMAKSWKWDFGDGSTDTAQNPVHKYSQPGTYNVCLIISDSAACNDTVCKSVTVTGTPGGGGSCTANFNANATGFNNEMQFSNTSFPQNATWQWDFGDGQTDTAKSPVHNYASPGSYYVCLVMTDSSGCKDTICDTITVNAGFPTGIAGQSPVTLRVYPNPGSDFITAEFATVTAGNSFILLTDVAGRELHIPVLVQGNRTLLDVRTISDGIYLLKIRHNENHFSERIVIVR